MESWFGNIPPVNLALAAEVVLATLVGLATRRRGGRYRGVMGWVVFWLVFSAILVGLSRGPAWAALVMFGLGMFVVVRAYFFVAPVRPRDRYAVLAAYLAIPFALWPGFIGSNAMFLATVPVVLFLVFPVLLSAGAAQAGLLDSMGRILLGTVVFVFCPAHLGLLVRSNPEGLLELFGVLALAADLPQRVIGRFGPDFSGWIRSTLGTTFGFVLAVACGFWLGPKCGLVEEDAARAGLLVAAAVMMGGLVGGAVIRDLGMTASEARVGRGALLDQAIPALYAAPVYFHYLNHFA